MTPPSDIEVFKFLADGKGPEARPFQFSLRAMLLAVAAFALLLGLGVEFGFGASVLGGIALGALLGLYFGKGKHVLGALGVLVLLAMVFSPGAHHVSEYTCSRCRASRRLDLWYGLPFHRVTQTACSRWYRENYAPHECRWCRSGYVGLFTLFGARAGVGDAYHHPIHLLPSLPHLVPPHSCFHHLRYHNSHGPYNYCILPRTPRLGPRPS